MIKLSGKLGYKLIALYEAGKALVVLVAGFGFLSLINQGIQDHVENVVLFLHLNPAHKFPHILIDTLSNATNVQLWLLSSSSIVYAVVQLLLAYGLWYKRDWAAWFVVASTILYIPVEVYELVKKITIMRESIFFANVLLVIYLFASVAFKNKKKKTAEDFQDENKSNEDRADDNKNKFDSLI
jgi:uncharacterized membrane protein (DUF2068 family)